MNRSLSILQKYFLLLVSFITIVTATYFHDVKAIHVYKPDLIILYIVVNFFIISFEIILQSNDQLHLLNTKRYQSNLLNFFILIILAIYKFDWMIIFLYFQGVIYLLFLVKVIAKTNEETAEKITREQKLDLIDFISLIGSTSTFIYSAFVFNFYLNMMVPIHLESVDSENIKSLLLIIFRFLPLAMTFLMMPVSQNLPTITRNMLTKDYKSVHFTMIWNLGVSAIVALLGLTMIFIFPSAPIFGYIIILRALCLVFTFYDSLNSLIGPVSIILILSMFPIGLLAVVLLLALVTICWIYLFRLQAKK